jgi:ubiquitin-protein ligase
MTMSAPGFQDHNPRVDRLMLEKERLDVVNRESDYVRARAASPVGGVPERYIVTFQCRGIVGIDANKYPCYADTHEVEIYCDAEFPSEVPRLRWITPIWHPNIQHLEPKNVCVNKHEWLGGMGLDRLCWLMFDMVQYRNYHAEHTPPFPLDTEAARWVREFAEPNEIVNKAREKYIDNKPFFRPSSRAELSEGRGVAAHPPKRRVMFMEGPRPMPTVRAAAADGITCSHCGAPVRRDARFCDRCSTPIRRVSFLQ